MFLLSSCLFLSWIFLSVMTIFAFLSSLSSALKATSPFMLATATAMKNTAQDFETVQVLVTLIFRYYSNLYEMSSLFSLILSIKCLPLSIETFIWLQNTLNELQQVNYIKPVTTCYLLQWGQRLWAGGAVFLEEID